MNILSNIFATWPAPANVSAVTTTRLSGYSQGVFARNNLALHVNDDVDHVQNNRRLLKQSLTLPAEPIWLNQTHSTHCVMVDEDDNRDADAAISRQYGRPLAIMTADCLPIVLCNQSGTEIAAIHAGWRGLVNGIVNNTVNKLSSNPNTVLAWIGPAICSTCFEIGPEVREMFLQTYSFTEHAFHQNNHQLYANLPLMAELILQELGISAIYHSNLCTFESENTFYSYRRSKETGRIATLIWFNQDK